MTGKVSAFFKFILKGRERVVEWLTCNVLNSSHKKAWKETSKHIVYLRLHQSEKCRHLFTFQALLRFALVLSAAKVRETWSDSYGK